MNNNYPRDNSTTQKPYQYFIKVLMEVNRSE